MNLIKLIGLSLLLMTQAFANSSDYNLLQTVLRQYVDGDKALPNNCDVHESFIDVDSDELYGITFEDEAGEKSIEVRLNSIAGGSEISSKTLSNSNKEINYTYSYKESNWVGTIPVTDTLKVELDQNNEIVSIKASSRSYLVFGGSIECK